MDAWGGVTKNAPKWLSFKWIWVLLYASSFAVLSYERGSENLIQ